jgi:hypothetical protein
MACPERELLESEVKQAHKRWTDLEDKAGAAIGKADPNSNQYLVRSKNSNVRRPTPQNEGVRFTSPLGKADDRRGTLEPLARSHILETDKPSALAGLFQAQLVARGIRPIHPIQEWLARPHHNRCSVDSVILISA